MSGEHPSLVALATSFHTHMGIGSGNTWPWPGLLGTRTVTAGLISSLVVANSGCFDEGILLSQGTRTCSWSDQVFPVKTMTKDLAGSLVLGSRGQAGEENGRRGWQGLIGTEVTVWAAAVLLWHQWRGWAMRDLEPSLQPWCFLSSN